MALIFIPRRRRHGPMAGEAVVHFGSAKLRPPAAHPLAVKGWAGLASLAFAAVIADAVYRATGKRARDLPITLDRLQRERGTRSINVAATPEAPCGFNGGARW